MKHSRESVLFVIFLLLLAGVILFNLFTSPAMYRAKVTALKETVPTSLQSTESEPLSEVSETSDDVNSYSGKVNINTAGVEELQTLPGIGEVKARKIVEDRNQNGRFATPQDLTRVNGIGEKTLQKILNQITV